MFRPGFLFALLVSVIVSGCSKMPGSGPKAGSFDSEAASYHSVEDEQLDFILVDVNPRVAAVLKQVEQDPRHGWFPMGAPGAVLRIKIGDSVKIQIYESTRGGLFLNEDANLPAGNNINVPEQLVSGNGHIRVPFVGNVKAANLMPHELAVEIERRLEKRAIEPQVIVTHTQAKERGISVTGKVRVPDQFPIPQGGIRVLDAIAKARGAEIVAHELSVTIHRDGIRKTVMLQSIINNPSMNIFLKRGDVVAVEQQQRFYSVMGATNVPSRIAFASETMSIQDGLAAAHGIFNERGDPTNVVIYRVAHKHQLQKMGVDMSNWQYGDAHIPTIYRFDLKKPSGFFLAREVPLLQDDLIYIADSEVSDFIKLKTVLQSVTNTEISAAESIIRTHGANRVLQQY